LPIFRVTYTSDRPYELVEADRIDVEGSNGLLIFRREVSVMNRPRDIVARRISAADVATVEQVEES
jgi:hypothetical protein